MNNIKQSIAKNYKTMDKLLANAKNDRLIRFMLEKNKITKKEKEELERFNDDILYFLEVA